MESLVIAVNSSNPTINVWVFIISLNHQNDPHTIIEITSDGSTLYYIQESFSLVYSL